MRAVEPHVRRQLERPELTREADLLPVVDRLVAYDEHGETRHRVIHGSDEFGGRWQTQIGAKHFGGEQRMERVYVQGQSEPSNGEFLTMMLRI